MHHRTASLRSLDGTALQYQVWLPEDTPPRAVVSIVPGWSDHSGRYQTVVDALVPAGIGVYAVDLRGHGHSAGKRGHINSWEDYRGDAYALVGMVREQHPDIPRFLFGHSMGGLVTLDFVIHHPEQGLRGLICSAPFLASANVSPVMAFLGRALSRVYPNLSLDPGAAPGSISRDPAVIAENDADPLAHNLATPRLSTEINATQAFVLGNLDAVRLPYLLMLGSADPLVPPHVSRDKFKDIGSEDKTIHEYEGAYHEVFNDYGKEQFMSDLIVWINAHI